MSSAASWNTGGSVRARVGYERSHLHQYVEALRREGPYISGEKPADRNKSPLSKRINRQPAIMKALSLLLLNAQRHRKLEQSVETAFGPLVAEFFLGIAFKD